MKRYTMEHYLRDLRDVTKQLEEGLITEGELLLRIHDISLRIAVATRVKARAELMHARYELRLISQLLN